MRQEQEKQDQRAQKGLNRSQSENIPHEILGSWEGGLPENDSGEEDDHKSREK